MRGLAQSLRQKYTLNISNYSWISFEGTTKRTVKPSLQKQGVQEDTHTPSPSPSPSCTPRTPTFLSSRQILTFPLPAGPMTNCAYRGISPLGSRHRQARTTEPYSHAPFSLRATPTEFQEQDLRTNRNPISFCSYCSDTPLTTECPAGQIPCDPRPG